MEDTGMKGTKTKRAIANAAMWVSLALNVTVVVGDLAVGLYTSAVMLMVVAVGQTAWLARAPKIDRWLDAQVDEAIDRQLMAGTALQTMREQIRAGHVSVTVHGEGKSERRR